MNKIRDAFKRRQSYERLEADSQAPGGNEALLGGKTRFSWIKYFIFVLLGIAMLWAWNMFLAAGPYFQSRFKTSKPLLNNFQAAELFVATFANLSSMIILSKIQVNASYPRRIVSALVTAAITFTLLSISTKIELSADVYFGFLIVMILIASLATGFMQNGTFSYVSSYGRQDYVQAIMTGQAIAGVLPPIAQIVTVLASQDSEAGQESSTSAMTYFLTATGVACLTLLAFLYLKYNHPPPTTKPHSTRSQEENGDSNSNSENIAERGPQPGVEEEEKQVPLLRLAWKLRYSAAAVFITFAVTMMFPVFTQEIISTDPDPPALFQKGAFIPLAFLVWNVGDLLGRVVTVVPRISLSGYPKILLIGAVLRIIWVPLYLSCNIQPAEVKTTAPSQLPTVRSDMFYLIIVQFLFGLTNGYIGSSCMMGTNAFVEENELEAAGGFMGLILVSGLSVGSVFSFLVGNTP